MLFCRVLPRIISAILQENSPSVALQASLKVFLVQFYLGVSSFLSLTSPTLCTCKIVAEKDIYNLIGPRVDEATGYRAFIITIIHG